MNKRRTTCLDCKHRHDYYKRKLTNKEAWCVKLSKLVRDKKNCIHMEQL